LKYAIFFAYLLRKKNLFRKPVADEAVAGMGSDQGFLAAARTGVFSGSVLVPDDLERIDL